ncbi:MAG: serine hydrolase domain-containing protein, partial [Oscillospiraceae bacterium]|nr:serine hydrolase domain-containing protein [Oscillospiraceae bacterium]
ELKRLQKAIKTALPFIESYTRHSTAPALSIGLFREGKRLLLRCGEDGLKHEEDARSYEYGSISKTFTGCLLAKRVREGAISLEDSVSDYIEGLPSGFYYPTIEQLATHTAGYGETLPRPNGSVFVPLFGPKTNPFKDYRDVDTDSFAAYARLEKKEYPPVYSNLGVTILGRVIALSEGLSVFESLERFVKDELGLKDISLGFPAEGAVCGRGESGEDCGNWQWGRSPFICMGGLYGSASSLLDYAEIILENKRPYFELALEARAKSFNPGALTGLCWQLYPQWGVAWHNGGTGCFKTFFGISKEKRAAACVLSNQKERGGTTPEEIGLALLRAL